MRELPPGWARVVVDDVTSEVRSGYASGKHNATGEGIAHLRPMNVSRLGEIDLSEVKYVDPVVDDRRLEPGDILFNNTNSPALVGKTALVRQVSGEQAFSNHMTRLRAVPGVVPAFLAAQLHFLWMTGRLSQLITNHVNQASISAKVLTRQVQLVLPSTDEQERIVAAIEEHLSRLDAAESVLTSAGERVAFLARAGVRQLLESRPWPWKTLGEIAEIKGGVTKDSKRQSDPSFVEVPYLRVANVQRGRLELSEVTTIRVHPDKAKALRLEPGDVLMNEGGDRDKLGRGWVWEGQVADCIHQNHVFRARLNDDFDPCFVSTHANTWGQAWFEEHGRQTTNLASINLGTLKQLPVPAPPRSEQEAIVAQLHWAGEAQKRLLASIDHAQARAQALRRSILAAAFSGQLVSQHPDDEPASVLLERIRAERAAATPTKRTRKAKAS